MSEKNIVLSIVIPVYNAEKTIRETLDSVLNQSLKEIEVICVDDGSTDDSVKVIGEYMKKDPRVSLLRQQNLYAGAARNAGIEAAKGEYLFFLDADDYVLDYALEAVCDKARRYQLDVLKFLALTYDEKGNRYVEKKYNSGLLLWPKDYNRLLTMGDNSPLMRISVVPWSGIYRRAFLMEKNCRFNRLRCVNDRSFYTKVMTTAERIMISRDRVTVHRENQDQSLVGKRAEHFDCQIESVRITEEQLRADGISPENTELIMRQEYQDLVFWYRRFSVDEKRKEEMDRQLEEYYETAGSDYDVILKNRLRAAKALPVPQSSDGECTPFHEPSAHPTVTVLVPVRNAEETLNQALDCLTNQTMEDMEFLLLDAGSGEYCSTIMKEYAAVDKRFTIVKCPENSYGALMNKGLDMARGEYLGILHMGDWADRGLYQRLVHVSQKYRLDLVRTNIGWYQPEKGMGPNVRAEKVLANQALYEMTLKPAKQIEVFQCKAQARNGLYRLDRLREKGVRWCEGPGFAFREDSFAFLSLCAARRVRFLPKAQYLEQQEEAADLMIGEAEEHNLVEEYAFIREKLAEDPKANALFGELAAETQLKQMLELRSRLASGRKERYTLEIREALKGVKIDKPPEETLLRLREQSRLEQIRKDPAGLSEQVDISVIQPVFRAGPDLETCMQALLCKSDANLEVICVDAGGEEGTAAALEALAAKDSRIRPCAVEQKSVGAALNKGLELARGTWCFFASAGDCYRQGMLDQMWYLGELEQLDVAAMFGEGAAGSRILGKPRETLVPVERPFTGEALERYCFTLFSEKTKDKLFRTELIRGNGLTFPEKGQKPETAVALAALVGAKRIDILNWLRPPVTMPELLPEEEEDEPDGGYPALIGLRENLKKLDVFPQFEKYYVNFALHYSLLRMTGAPEAEYRRIYEALQSVRLQELGIAERKPNYFFNKVEFEQMEQIKKLDAMEFLLYSLRDMRQRYEGLLEPKQENPLLSSAAYRVGRVITWLPQKGWTSVKLIREKGFGFLVEYGKDKGRKVLGRVRKNN